MRKKPYQIVYVEWDDAVCAPAGWHKDPDEWIENTQFIISEVGFLLREDKKAIYLASFWKPEDSETVEQFGNLRRIPKGWLKKRVLLK
jgi:hypothetical protein